MLRIREGLPHLPGATWDGEGVNFSLFSANANKVELCLFDSEGKSEIERIELPEYTDQFFHGWVGDLLPGQVYGYRVHDPYEPVVSAGRTRETAGSLRDAIAHALPLAHLVTAFVLRSDNR